MYNRFFRLYSCITFLTLIAILETLLLRTEIVRDICQNLVEQQDESNHSFSAKLFSTGFACFSNVSALFYFSIGSLCRRNHVLEGRPPLGIIASGLETKAPFVWIGTILALFPLVALSSHFWNSPGVVVWFLLGFLVGLLSLFFLASERALSTLAKLKPLRALRDKYCPDVRKSDFTGIDRWYPFSLVALPIALVVIVIGFAKFPDTFANFTGALAPALVGVSLWISFAGWSFFIQVSRGFRPFILYIWVVLGIQFFNLSPGREIAHKDVVRQPVLDSDLGSAIERFMVMHEGELKAMYDQKRRMPIYLVAAQGGGIRAAAHTMMFLDKMADDDYVRVHTFGMSGVSGGSVGIGFHLAALASGTSQVDANSQKEPPDSRLDFEPRIDSNGVEDFEASLLTHDFLSGVLARGLIMEPFLDRGQLLAKGFEAGVAKALPRCGTPAPNVVELSFNELYTTQLSANSPDEWLPLVFFNATSQTTGESVPLGPVRLRRLRREDYDETEADQKFINSISISELMSASSRFPVVTPTVTINGNPFVDGGYSDNLGDATVNRLIEGFNRYKAGNVKSKPWITAFEIKRVRITSMSDKPITAFDAHSRSSASSLLAPLYTMAGVWGNSQGYKQLDSEIVSQRDDNLYPLTWIISGHRLKVMRRSLELNSGFQLKFFMQNEITRKVNEAFGF